MVLGPVKLAININRHTKVLRVMATHGSQWSLALALGPSYPKPQVPPSQISMTVSCAEGGLKVGCP